MGITLPKKWIRNKSYLGVLVFDLQDEEEKYMYEDQRRKIKWR